MKKHYDFSKAKIHKGSLLKGALRLDEDICKWLGEQGRVQETSSSELVNRYLRKAMDEHISIEARLSRIEKFLGI